MSDGTAAGTVEVADISPGVSSSNLKFLTAAGGRLFFRAEDDLINGVIGRELWTSDGTAGGTVVFDIFSGLDPDTGRPNSGDPKDLTELGGQLFFSANDGGGETDENSGQATGRLAARCSW